MCFEEILKECHKEAQVVSPYPMNPYSIHEWMTEYTAQA